MKDELEWSIKYALAACFLSGVEFSFKRNGNCVIYYFKVVRSVRLV